MGVLMPDGWTWVAAWIQWEQLPQAGLVGSLIGGWAYLCRLWVKCWQR